MGFLEGAVLDRFGGPALQRVDACIKSHARHTLGVRYVNISAPRIRENCLMMLSSLFATAPITDLFLPCQQGVANSGTCGFRLVRANGAPGSTAAVIGPRHLYQRLVHPIRLPCRHAGRGRPDICSEPVYGGLYNRGPSRSTGWSRRNEAGFTPDVSKRPHG